LSITAVSDHHVYALTENEPWLLPEVTSMIRFWLGPRLVYSSIQQKNLVSDVGLRQRSVKLKEKETKGLQKPRPTTTDGASLLKYPRPGEPNTGAGRKTPRAGSRRTLRQAETNPLEAGSAPV